MRRRWFILDLYGSMLFGCAVACSFCSVCEASVVGSWLCPSGASAASRTLDRLLASGVGCVVPRTKGAATVDLATIETIAWNIYQLAIFVACVGLYDRWMSNPDHRTAT